MLTLGINAAYHASALLLERGGATLPLEPSAGVAPGLEPWEPLFVSYIVNAERHPVVSTPRDAFESFWKTPLDVLVIGPLLIQKPLIEK